MLDETELEHSMTKQLLQPNNENHPADQDRLHKSIKSSNEFVRCRRVENKSNRGG